MSSYYIDLNNGQIKNPAIIWRGSLYPLNTLKH